MGALRRRSEIRIRGTPPFPFDGPNGLKIPTSEVPVRRLLIVFLPFLLACQSADDTADESRTDYLGQSPPGVTARLFAPGFVSTEDGELNSVFSSDFQEFYFTRRGIPTIPPAIMISKRGADGWDPPEPVGFDERYSAIDLFITPDGRRMVFCSNRPHEEGDSPRTDHDFWVSVRDDGGWSDPQPFAPAAQSDSEDFFPIVTDRGSLYFNSQRDGPGTNNIFRSSLVGGEYLIAEKLPAPINSEYREFDAFVTGEGEMMVFSSDRPGGFGGSDIYLSFLENGQWSEPRNLGEAVNSESSEYGAMLTPDGRYLFFTSTRSGMEDVYWISSSILDRPE